MWRAVVGDGKNVHNFYLCSDYNFSNCWNNYFIYRTFAQGKSSLKSRKRISHFQVSFIRQSITSIGRSSKGNSKSQGRGGKGDQTLRRSIKLFTSVLVISWLPVVIWKIIRLCGFELDDKFCYGYSKFAETSLWIGPALNPILYSFLGRRFRKDLLATFPCIKQEQNPIISEYTQQSRATVNTTNELSLQMINDEEKQLLPVS